MAEPVASVCSCPHAFGHRGYSVSQRSFVVGFHWDDATGVLVEEAQDVAAEQGVHHGQFVHQAAVVMGRGVRRCLVHISLRNQVMLCPGGNTRSVQRRDPPNDIARRLTISEIVSLAYVERMTSILLVSGARMGLAVGHCGEWGRN